MEFSEKDAARRKFKLTQRHSRGRGRGGGGRSGGGRGGKKAGSAALDLGTNEYRFRDEAAEAAAAAAALGPVQQSQGADLAELLSRAEPFDQAYYYRARVNLAEEFGPPPEAATGGYQGLSLDLQGLATCLAALPKNQLLDTDAFSSDGDDGWGSQDSEGEEGGELADLAPQAARPDTHSSGAAAQQPATAATGEAAAAAHTAAAVGLGTAGAAVQSAAPIPTTLAAGAAAAVRDVPAVPQTLEAPASGADASGEADELLSELLGGKAVIGSAKSGTAAPAKWTAAGPAAASSQAQAQHAVSTQQPMAGAPLSAGPKPQAPVMQTLAPEADDELDMLLGLSMAPSAAKPGGAVALGSERHSSNQTQAAAQAQSLEDWLDGL